MITEVACANIDSVENALAAGADRIELCAALSVGGITPSFGLIKAALSLFPNGVFVLIRPREGNFIYSDEEFNVMLNDISEAKKLGAKGIVSGVLTGNNKIDRERTKKLVEASSPLQFTFHRAFDLIADPYSGAETLIELGVNRILTSGQKPSAYEGRDLIKKLNENFGKEIIILAGAGIDPNHAREIVDYTFVNEIHFSAKRKIQESSSIALGASDDGSYEVSDLMTIKLIISEIGKATTL